MKVTSRCDALFAWRLWCLFDPANYATAEWKDIDLEAAEWRYMVTKTDIPHIVPLSTQAVADSARTVPAYGRGPLRVPGGAFSSRPMSDNAVLAAMRRMGIGKEEMTGHGFRAVARTILDEVLGFRPDFIEHQLAHAVRDPIGRAYNRTAHLPERRKMMQKWADYLDKLKAGNWSGSINRAKQSRAGEISGEVDCRQRQAERMSRPSSPG